MTTGTGGDGAARSAPVARRGSARRGLLTEGPRWDADRAELLWVDILAGEVHTAAVGDDGDLEPVRTVQVGRHVGAAVPAAAGGYMTTTAGHQSPAHHPTRPPSGPQNAAQGAVSGREGATRGAGVAA